MGIILNDKRKFIWESENRRFDMIFQNNYGNVIHYRVECDEILIHTAKSIYNFDKHVVVDCVKVYNRVKFC